MGQARDRALTAIAAPDKFFDVASVLPTAFVTARDPSLPRSCLPRTGHDCSPSIALLSHTHARASDETLDTRYRRIV